ncbi:MAG: hypothetical protein ACYDH9_06425 [Limisphaerales bacterium]
MQPHPEHKLEAAIHEQLRKLPELTAPPALLPRVLAVIQARVALPWWRRSWWDWPLSARAAFASLVVVSVALLAYLGAPLWAGFAGSAPASFAGRWVAAVIDSVKSLEPLANAGAVLWRATAQPVIIGLLVVSSLMYLLCLGLGSMFLRVALRRI